MSRIRSAVLAIICGLYVLSAAIPSWAEPNTREVRLFRAIVPDYSRTSGGYSPALSPNGHTMAFMDASGDVYIISNLDLFDEKPIDAWKLRIDTAQQQQFSSHEQGKARNLDWSPDGKRLAIAYRDGNLYVADNFNHLSKRATIRQIANASTDPSGVPAMFRLPRWSRDGRKVAVERCKMLPQMETEIWVTNLENGRQTLLAKDAASGDASWEQPWSPDSKSVTYTRRANPSSTQTNVVVTSIDGTQTRLITSDGKSGNPSWSPTSNQIAFSSQTDAPVKLKSGGTSISANGIYLADSQGRNRRLIFLPDTSTNRKEMLQAEAESDKRTRREFIKQFRTGMTDREYKRFAAGKMTDNEMDIIAVRTVAKKTAPAVLKHLDLLARHGADVADWLQKLLKYVPKDKQQDFVRQCVTWKVTALRPFLEIVISNVNSAGEPVWSPDGKMLAFTIGSWTGENQTLCVSDLNTRRVRELYTASEVAAFTWAAGGKVLILQSKRAMSMSLDDDTSEASNSGSFDTTTTTPGYPEIWMLCLDAQAAKQVRTAKQLPQEQPGNQLAMYNNLQQSNQNAQALPQRELTEPRFIFPNILGLNPGSTQQFKLLASVSGGRIYQPKASVRWEADPQAGTITPGGLFTAGKNSGVYTSGVKAIMDNGREFTAAVRIIPPTPQGGYTLTRSLGGQLDGYLHSPNDLAVDANGDVYVTESDGRRVQKFDSNGHFLKSWSLDAWNVGFINALSAIEVGPNGDIFTLHSGLGLIQEFTPYGKYIREWKIPDYSYPLAMTVAQDGSVYVTDVYRKDIRRLDTKTGKFTSWDLPLNSKPTNPNLDKPYLSDIYTDTQGNVYAADLAYRCVWKFGPTGNYIMQWGSSGDGKGQFLNPFGLTSDPDGNIYVCDGVRIQKFDRSGTFITSWGGVGSEDAQFSDATRVAVGPGGCIYVADRGNNRIQKFDSQGKYLTQWGKFGDRNGILERLQGVSVSSAGGLYLSLSDTGYLVILDSKFSVSRGLQTAQEVRTPFVDANGNLYAESLYSISKYDPLGRLVTTWGSKGTGNGQFDYARGLAVDSQGNIYVGDVMNNRVQKFDSNGNYITQWGSKGNGNGQFDPIGGIAVDSKDCVYVSDLGSHRIEKFDSNGNYTMQWGAYGTTDGRFMYPWGLAVDSQDNILVADTGNQRVQKFDSGGNYLGKLDLGSMQPGDVSIDSQGNLYVSGRDGGAEVRKYSPVTSKP